MTVEIEIHPSYNLDGEHDGYYVCEKGELRHWRGHHVAMPNWLERLAGNLQRKYLMVNVGVDQWRFYPITMEEILKAVKRFKQNGVKT